MGFYARIWFYLFVVLAPLLVWALVGMRAWVRERPIAFAFLVALSINVLAFFMQFQDARNSSYSYVAVIVAVVSSFARASQGKAGRPSVLRAVALTAVAVLVACQLRGTPVNVLAPNPEEFLDPAREPWPKVLLKQSVSDRFNLQRHCGATNGRFCNAAPFVTHPSPYQTYTWRYYNCLKTRSFDRCEP